MDRTVDPEVREAGAPTLRIDAAHAAPDAHRSARLDRRRVRQVLVGSAGGRSMHSASAGSPATLRLCSESTDEALAAREHVDPVWKRFRQNFDTLTHIARDPLVWYAEDGEILTDLRETLVLTETALRQAEWSECDRLVRQDAAASVLALAHVVDARVDALFDRMERLCGLRQTMYRLSALIENVPCGSVPAFEEIEQIARQVVESHSRETEADAAVTLVHPEATDRAIRVAAHGLNVAQVAVRLALSAPAWRDEAVLAAASALLIDVGMLEVPNEITTDLRPLSQPQRALIERHPITSAAIVEQMRGHDERIIAGVRGHHERLDGSGYPDRLQGDDVGSLARLLAVADVYVGMQSARPYRTALRAEQALAEVDAAAERGQLDAAWAARLPSEPPRWLRIPVTPLPPSSAPALSALAA